jgi:hypothetical protein
MKPKVYVILDMAISEGIARGWHLAHKHVEHPEEHVILERINDAVMSAITEYFTFEDNELT